MVRTFNAPYTIRARSYITIVYVIFNCPSSSSCRIQYRHRGRIEATSDRFVSGFFFALPHSDIIQQTTTGVGIIDVTVKRILLISAIDVIVDAVFMYKLNDTYVCAAP